MPQSSSQFLRHAAKRWQQNGIVSGNSQKRATQIHFNTLKCIWKQRFHFMLRVLIIFDIFKSKICFWESICYPEILWATKKKFSFKSQDTFCGWHNQFSNDSLCYCLMLTYSMSFILPLTVGRYHHPKCLSVSMENQRAYFILKFELRFRITNASIMYPPFKVIH